MRGYAVAGFSSCTVGNPDFSFKICWNKMMVCLEGTKCSTKEGSLKVLIYNCFGNKPLNLSNPESSGSYAYMYRLFNCILRSTCICSFVYMYQLCQDWTIFEKVRIFALYMINVWKLAFSFKTGSCSMIANAIINSPCLHHLRFEGVAVTPTHTISTCLSARNLLFNISSAAS